MITQCRGVLTSITDRQDSTEDTSPASMASTRSELVRVEGVLEDTMVEEMESHESAFYPTSSFPGSLLLFILPSY